MKKILITIALVVTLHFGAGSASAQTEFVGKALILYDSSSTQYKKLGLMYSIMLRNLLGHFYMNADLVPVESYTAGKLEAYPVTFYLGALYDNPVPDTFLVDVAKTSKKVVWFKYNLWQYAWDPAYGFQQKYGFNFVGLRGLNATPSSTNPNPGFFDTVLYKGKSLVKYYDYNPSTRVVTADPEFGVTTITDTLKAKIPVAAKNGRTGEQAPYIVRSGNFWYFADLPFSFIGPRDRYLVFCDVLHDIIGVNHPTLRRAMVRLEDVGANVNPNAMKTLTDFLVSKKIRFSIAAIPFYRDPLGYYNGGTPQEVRMANAPDLLDSLRYATARGGSVLMHGYTHQYNSTPNLHTAVSGDDFEFWNATKNTVVTEDSSTWASNRIAAGLSEMNAFFKPFAWEAPHYQASATAYRVFSQHFKDTYQRAVYYTATRPALNGGGDFAGGMFYPYIIASDFYGQRVMPENLGNIEYDINHIDPTSNINYTWRDLLTNAEYALVVRDGFASFFFHPFWIEPELSHLNAFSDFQSLVNGITALGYTWVSGIDLIIKAGSVAPTSGTTAGATALTIKGQGFEPGAGVWIGGIKAKNIKVVSPTTITCDSPANGPGPKNVVVKNLDGRSAPLTNAYSYF